MTTRQIEYTGPGEWTFLPPLVSDCCDATCHGELSADGRDAIGPTCDECGELCELVDADAANTARGERADADMGAADIDTTRDQLRDAGRNV